MNFEASRYVYEQESLSGHRKSIDCLKVKSFQSSGSAGLDKKTLVFSGSEDRTLRVWEGTSLRSIKCFLSNEIQSNIDSIDFHPQNESIVFIAAGNRLISLDISTPNVIERNIVGCFQSSEISGEINALAVHPTKLLGAVSDDSSAVFLIPFNLDGTFTPANEKDGKGDSALSTAPLSVFRRYHSNIINCLCFTTHLKRDELYVGGFDCEISYWDVAKLTRPNKTIKLMAQEEFQTNTQTLNPPFVHSLNLICNNKVLLVAAGDGSIRLYHSSQLSLLHQKLVHTGPISSVKVIGNYIISGGLDQWIYCHEVIAIAKNKAPTQFHLQFVWSVQHNEKINVIDGRIIPESNRIQLFLSDISPILFVYQIFLASEP